jgi:hypothetical protein
MDDDVHACSKNKKGALPALRNKKQRETLVDKALGFCTTAR